MSVFVDVAFTHGEVEHIQLSEYDFIAVIDVLRATTTITTALMNGARGVKPVATPEEARAFAEEMRGQGDGPDVLLGGEREARLIPGFDLGNSPFEYTPETVGGRLVAVTTTNGTQAFRRVEGARGIVVAACLRNAEAVVDEMIRAGGGRDGFAVLLVCAGTDGRFSADDAYCAATIVKKLSHRVSVQKGDGAGATLNMLQGVDISHASESQDPPAYRALYRSRHGQRLWQMGLEKDLRFCAETDAVDGVPRLKMGILVLQ